MGRFAEKVRLKDFRLTPYQINGTIKSLSRGDNLYTDAVIRKNKSFITIVALDELKLAKENSAALEKRVAELSTKKIYSEVHTA